MGEETEIAEPKSSDDAVATAHEPSKDKSRKRKKLLYKSIRELMEFYLGNVNLSKSRFMYDLIQGQPFKYVDLTTFLTFNKLRQLTTSVEEVAKAISSSEILQLSEDRTQVCRITPILKKENEEECSIYVEQIGPDVDHDSITLAFSEFGPVDYVSLPKFSSNNKNKGFAFVEFKNVESAKKALETFNARGCCLSPHMAPEQLLSIKNFDPKKDIKNKESTSKTEHKKESYTNEEENKDAKKNKKRKHSESDDQGCKKKIKSQESEIESSLSKCNQKPDEEVSNKKNKKCEELNNDTPAEKSPEVEESKKRRKRKKSKDADTKKEDEMNDPEQCSKKMKLSLEVGAASEDSLMDSAKEEEDEIAQSDDGSAAGESSKQKKRRKKKKVKKDKSTANTSGFKILSKKDWKHLRNKYLNMQKNTMRSLKQHLSYSSKWEKTRQAPQVVEHTQEKDEKLVSGTVIKVTLEEPVINVQATKLEMRIHPEIKYVDATENSPHVYIRTSAPEFATAILQTKPWTNMEVIKDDDESQYWTKMKTDRENKCINKKHKQNQRGRTKLLKKAERFQGKHITFDAQ